MSKNKGSKEDYDIRDLPLEDVALDPKQPRKIFYKGKLRELAESIKQNGLLHPILVRPLKDGKFEIVHGERRCRACRMAGMKTIRAEIREINDREKLEIQLIENVQRQDLNPIEEAETFQKMITEFGYTHKILAKRIGKSREYITNKLRLLKLPLGIQIKLRKGLLSEGHARAILSLDESDLQKELTKTVVDNELTVRETKQLVNSIKGCSDVTRETFITSTEAETNTPDIPKDGLVVGVWVSAQTHDVLAKLANSNKTTIERLCSELIERGFTK